jgi:hypothetical protein
MGIEPATCCLRNSCSTTELRRHGRKLYLSYFSAWDLADARGLCGHVENGSRLTTAIGKCLRSKRYGQLQRRRGPIGSRLMAWDG